jgi:hypothetical protein
MEFGTPWAAVVALAAVVPVAAWVLGTRRSATVRLALGLGPPARRNGALIVGALVLSIVLLALAAAQPVIAARHHSTVRREADVFVVLDTSRSMLASRAAGTTTRFARATAIAHALDEALPTAAVGIASMTDRVLPHLFPTQDRVDFDLALREAVAVQRPPPAEVTRDSGTDLGSLGDLALAHFFAPGKNARIAVVLTDGESRAFAVQHVANVLRQARIQPILIRVGTSGERVWGAGGKSESYRPSRVAGVELARTAVGLGGRAYDEGQAGVAIAEIAGAVGGDSVQSRRTSTSIRSLAPFLALASLVPVAFVLWRRNIG